MAKEYIKNTNNKLEESESVINTREYTLEGLRGQKIIINNEIIAFQKEIIVFQKKLEDIDLLITKANSLGVTE